MDDREPPSQHDGMLIGSEQVAKVHKSGSLEVDALKHVDLSVEQGQFVAIIGQSGSGKTTAAVISMIVIVEGGQRKLVQSIERLGTNLLFVFKKKLAAEEQRKFVGRSTEQRSHAAISNDGFRSNPWRSAS